MGRPLTPLPRGNGRQRRLGFAGRPVAVPVEIVWVIAYHADGPANVVGTVSAVAGTVIVADVRLEACAPVARVARASGRLRPGRQPTTTDREAIDETVAQSVRARDAVTIGRAPDSAAVPGLTSNPAVLVPWVQTV
jgi:hypothetical protein